MNGVNIALGHVIGSIWDTVAALAREIKSGGSGETDVKLSIYENREPYRCLQGWYMRPSLTDPTPSLKLSGAKWTRREVTKG